MSSHLKMHQFRSGAKSTVEKPRYDLIPVEALQALANRFGYGATRHGENNWRKGVHDQQFRRDRANHAFEHLYNYMNDRSTWEDNGNCTTPLGHLEAAITNLAILCGLEQMRVEAERAEQRQEDSDPLDVRKG